MTLTLPWPPSVNHYWRHVGARVLISSHGRMYRSLVLHEVRRQIANEALLGDARISVEIAAYPPDRRRRDLDNLQKGLLDSLTHAGVWDDDSQIDDLRIYRCAVEPPGRVEVAVRAIADLGKGA